MQRTENTPLITFVFFDNAGRLRSGWRFFVFLSTFLLISVFVNPVFGAILEALPFGFTPDSLFVRLGGSILGLVMALGVGWLCGKVLEGLPFRAIGASFSKPWLKDFVVGNLFGAITMTFAVGTAALLGGLTFRFNNAAGSSAILLTLAVTLVIFLFGAAFEEALMRGYMLQTFMRSNLFVLGLILTSLLFSSGHLFNKNVAVFSSINTALAGIWLGIAYFKTRTLWFAFGLHLSWNWVQGSVFGVEVSGFTNFATAPLMVEIDAGPAFVTGGDYGIEGGAACTIALLVSTAVIWFSPFLRASDEMISLTSKPSGNGEENQAI
ncbi:MAG: CPBP family intramembrane metalloprotease [Acidobacteriota bacterium]|nr:CPBP family intramembrane metalloprotease [Acidobacteriota bacterium]MDH3528592.1 CPBP family intramembrane metalloprotease [Acidobacteriota bacterium]